jgi:O-antigen ligase
VPSKGVNGAGGYQITIADRFLGALILVVGVVTVVGARATAFLLPVLAVAAIAALLIERAPLAGLKQVSRSTILVALLLGFAAISSAWSADPETTLSHALILLLMLLQWHILSYWISIQTEGRIQHLAHWLLIAIAIGMAILAFEVFAHQFLRRWIIHHFDILNPPTLNKHYRVSASGDVRIQGFELNRSVAAANFLVWPALLVASSIWSGRRLALVGAVLVGLLVALTLWSNHETSKIAVVVALIIFALAKIRPRLAPLALAAMWCTLILGIVPLAQIAYNQLELHKASWLQKTASERIIIWNDISGRVLESPLFGVGARTAHVLSADSEATIKESSAGERPAIARHAHNVYLQTWYELGLVGALLMLLSGLSILRGITALSEATRPFALAAAATFIAEIGSSWEIWQRWFFALFILAAVFLALAARSAEAGRRTSSS